MTLDPRATIIPPPSMVADPLFDIHSNDWLLNKHNHYKHLRSLPIAHYSERYGFYVFTRYADVSFILSNPNIFSSAQGNLPVEGSNIRFGRSLGASDNPNHTRLKGYVNRAYGPAATVRVARIFEDALERLLKNAGAVIDINDIIEEASSIAVAEIVNFPTGTEAFKKLIRDKHREAAEPSEQFIKTSTALIKEISARKPAPGPGVYADCLENDAEVAETLSLILSAVIAGATSLISAIQQLTIDIAPHTKELVGNKDLIERAIEESIRYHSSTGRFARTVTEPIMLHGVDLKAGDRVLACIESANRDEERFPDADIFDLKRNNKGHLGWGRSIHTCIALMTSQKLLEIYVNQLLAAVPAYRVATTAYEYHITPERNIDRLKSLEIERCE